MTLRPNDPLHQWTDEDLLEELRAGRRDVFGALVRRYECELFSYLRRYLGDDALAEDVFQNTFLQVYVKAGQYQPGRPVRPWLYTIATNQAIDAMRRAGRKAAVSLDGVNGEGDDGEPRSLLDLLEDREPGPPAAALTEERRLQVRTWVERLPDLLRQVVLLAYFQGLKYREIAEALDVPVGTVKSRLHAALVKLAELCAATPSLPEL